MRATHGRNNMFWLFVYSFLQLDSENNKIWACPFCESTLRNIVPYHRFDRIPTLTFASILVHLTSSSGLIIHSFLELPVPGLIFRHCRFGSSSLTSPPPPAFCRRRCTSPSDGPELLRLLKACFSSTPGTKPVGAHAMIHVRYMPPLINSRPGFFSSLRSTVFLFRGLHGNRAMTSRRERDQQVEGT